MSTEKPDLNKAYSDTGDIRVLYDLITKYQYTDDEVSSVLNFYEPDDDGKIPEVEHIECILQYCKNGKISDKTMEAIKKSYPWRLDYITKLQE